MAAPILVGTCNWADHEDFYPEAYEHGRRQRDRLTFYARYFPVLEVDSTFYGVPKPNVTDGWVQRTPPDFQFNVKAYRSLTGHEREGRTPRPPTAEEERDFVAALVPLRESGKLRAVHYQFPPWLTNTPQARELLLAARERHPDDIVAIEFRHRSWFDNDAWPHTEELLRELDCVYVGVDAPQVGAATAPPHLAITSPRLCIARFHGRNRRTWYIRGATSRDRFDYLYEPAELEQWVPALRAASERNVPVHALMNNNRSNYAVVNAFDLAAMLGVPQQRPPQPVIDVMRRRDGKNPAWVHDTPEPPAEEEPVPAGDPDADRQLRLAL